MARRGIWLQNQSKYPTIPLHKEEKYYQRGGLHIGLINGMSCHEPTVTLPEQGKNLGKGEILRFRDSFIWKKLQGQNPIK